MSTTEKKEPKLTLRLVAHLNGGSKFSSKTRQFYADGEPTGILLHEETNGRPEYRYTSKELCMIEGDDTLDLMVEENAARARDWIRERLPQVGS